MTRLQAAAFIVAFGLAIGMSIAIGMLIMFIRYELRDRRDAKTMRRNSGRVRVITGDPEIDASQLASTLRRQMSRRYSA